MARSTDSFTVATIDGTLRVVSITIDGANDAAVITGDAAGDVIEAGGINNGAPGVPTDIGDLDSTDVDNPADAWQAVAAGAATVNGYGSYALTAAGVWTYTLDNSNAAVQAPQRRRHLDRQLHGADRGRHRARGLHHHHRGQRHAGGGGGRQRRRCGDRERRGGRRSLGCGQRAHQRHRRRHWRQQDRDRGERFGAERRRAAGRHLRHADAPGRRQLELCAQRRRPRNQRPGGGSGRHRRLQLHRFRRQRRHLVRGADHHHYGGQRCAGGDRGGGQRRGDGRGAAGDGGGRYHRLRRRRSHRRPRHIGHAGGNWLSRHLCRGRDQRLDRRRHRAGDLAVRRQQCAAAVAR